MKGKKNIKNIFSILVRKLQSLENTKSNENMKQLSIPRARKEKLNETAETKKKFYWPSGTCPIVGDSMINGIDKKKKKKKN